MTFKKYIYAALLAGVGFSSCEKALEEKAYSFLSPNQFFKNEADALAAINGVYSQLLSWDLFAQPYWNFAVLDDDHISGADWYLSFVGAGNPLAYWGWERPWSGYYILIDRANTVLENVSGIEDMDTEIRERMLGEAYFLRGWSYFMLVQTYGAVPIRTASLAIDADANKPRESVVNVYNQAIEDFKNAESKLLPRAHAKSGGLGRVHRGVAKAFLAKTYLTMASGSLSGAQIQVRGGNDNAYYTHQKSVVKGLEGVDSKEYFKLARDKALEVVTDNDYSLATNWTDLWKMSNRNQGEHLWEIQALEGTFMNQIHNYFNATSTFGRGAVWMTNNHYLDYEENDHRALYGIEHNFLSNTGGRYYYPSWENTKYANLNGLVWNNNGGTDNRAYTIKYKDVSSPAVSQSDAFFPMMRLAEVMLMIAEADNEYNEGPTTVAYDYLDRVRRRSHADYSPENMTREAFRSFVIAERARELALEGVRRFDLLRWGIYLQVMNKITSGQNNISKLRLERNLLMPIPLSEITTNTAITENNYGW
jgi:hypothetical protein